MTTFDPFTATAEDARAQPEPREAFRRFKGAQILSRRQAYFEAVPMDGIAVCARFNLAPPLWLAQSFLRRFDAVLNFEARGWDEAFGPPRKKGINLAYARRRLKLREIVCREFVRVLQSEPWRAVDKLFWEEVGRAADCGATLAEETYREALTSGTAMTAAEARRFYRGEPAKFQKLAGVRRR